MISFAPSDLVSAWYETDRYPILSWSDLANRKSADDFSQQAFWLKAVKAGRRSTEQDLINSGVLVEASDGKLYHIAYIPWFFFDKNLAKSEWGDDRWLKLDGHIEEVVRANGAWIKKCEWSGLTIKASAAIEFLKAGMTACHLIGDIRHDQATASQLNGNLIEGDVYCRGPHFSNVVITGHARTYEESFRCVDSTIAQIGHSGRSKQNTQIALQNSKVGMLSASGEFNAIHLVDTSIAEGLFSNSEIFRVLITSDQGDRAALNFLDTKILGRFDIKGMTLIDPAGEDYWTLGHAKILEKATLERCVFPISIFADVQLEAPIDFKYGPMEIEDQFETELARIRTKKKRNPEVFDVRQKRLERACQLLCDRHRQDGRKDLEFRFRRLEIKARAYRQNSDRGTRALSWTYEIFSDFGRSPWRPLGGFLGITFTFFILYWMLGAVALGLSFSGAGPLNVDAVTDGALLAMDKAFPFGASVAEAELFEGRLLGADGGASGVLVGLLGAVQTILSGVMIFLMGLAVRTKLLIG